MSDPELDLLEYRLAQLEKRADRLERAILAVLIFAAASVAATILKVIGLFHV